MMPSSGSLNIEETLAWTAIVMKKHPIDRWPLGVFVSIDAGLGARLEVAHELGVPTIQLHAPHRGGRTPEQVEQLQKTLHELSIRVTVVFGGFEGESYADIPTVAQTVGLVPRETRAARAAEMKEIADFARPLGAEAVGLHLGLVPERRDDPDYRGVLAATQDLCDHCQSRGLRVHLETGQESVETLLQFLADAGRDNLFVNFDPANMILYGSGDPIEALGKVGRFVRSVHCKDATWAARPGVDWGAEVPLGEGDVNFERFLRTLRQCGYDGPLTIERETSPDAERMKIEIGQGIRLLQQLKMTILV